MQSLDETIRVWDAVAHEYRTVTVPASPVPRARTRRRAHRTGPAADYAGLSAESPVPYMADTAFAPSDGLADMRNWIKPPAMRTRRAPAVVPADPGRITETTRRAAKTA